MTEPEMDKRAGFIYVFTNPEMAGVVKVGMTQRDPDARAAELSTSSGVPRPFERAFSGRVSNCLLAERLVHEKLKLFRVSESREFFRIDLPKAIEIAQAVCDVLTVARPEPAEQYDVPTPPTGNGASPQAAPVSAQEMERRRHPRAAETVHTAPAGPQLPLGPSGCAFMPAMRHNLPSHHATL